MIIQATINNVSNLVSFGCRASEEMHRNIWQKSKAICDTLINTVLQRGFVKFPEWEDELTQMLRLERTLTLVIVAMVPTGLLGKTRAVLGWGWRTNMDA